MQNDIKKILTSQKPYLVRAIYEWCQDNGCTPYLATHVDINTLVPEQYVKDSQIVLDISDNATSNLLIDNEWITFKAAFDTIVKEVAIPIGNVLAIFAKETGQGMQFPKEEPIVDHTPDKPKLKLVK